MNAATPTWVLTFAYWFHMLATVVWIGGLAALSLFVLPAARRAMQAESYAAFLAQANARLQSLGWFSLSILVVTGLFQMSANRSYEGFLAIHNNWARAILAKHLLIGLMVLVSAYLTWFLHPNYQRLVLRQSKGLSTNSAQLQALQRRETVLLRLTLGISILVLVFTAIARVS